jgi:hypothetical protein
VGAKSGKRDELTMLYRVKPGREKEIRKELDAFYQTSFRKNLEDPRVVAINTKIGVHELRHVLFDNDTRLLWMTSFDTEWDPYVDDTFAVADSLVPYGKILQHTVEAPDGIADPDNPITHSSRAAKDLFLATRIVATGFAPTFPSLTCREILKGEQLRKAFQQVLDHPEAERALNHPALKPLLELASE